MTFKIHKKFQNEKKETIDSVTEFIYFSFSANASNLVNLNVFLIIDAMSRTRTSTRAHTHTHRTFFYSIFYFRVLRASDVQKYRLQFTQTYFIVLREKSFQYYLHFYSTRRIRQTISLNIWGFRFTLGENRNLPFELYRCLYSRSMHFTHMPRNRKKKHTHTQHEIELNADLIIISISSTSLFISFSLLKRISFVNNGSSYRHNYGVRNVDGKKKQKRNIFHFMCGGRISEELTS